MNLLLVDDRIPEVTKFTDACNSNTKYIIYNSFNDTFDSVKIKIANLEVTNFSNLGFVFVDEHSPLKLFVQRNSFISFSNGEIKENETTKFINYLVSNYNISTIDFLACNLLSYPIWKQYFEFIMADNIGVKVRASNDRTGNLNSGGDWVLENTDEDVRELYFNNNIINWGYLLDFGDYSCIMSDDTSNNLWVCGNNQNGKLGLGSIDRNIFTNSTIKTNDISFVAIACGSNHTIAITDDTSNNLWVCGSNVVGQLGLGAFGYNSDIDTFTNELSGAPFNNKKVIGISCGSNHTIVITDDLSNNLWVCGYNNTGQLGKGDTNDIDTFTNELSEAPFNNKKVIGVSCGSIHTIAITDDTSNNLWVCGYNEYGQLGIGNNIDKNTFTNELSGTPFNNKKVIGVSCGDNHTIVMTDDTSNNVWVCGSNLFGQLGLDNNIDKNTFTNELSGTLFKNKKVIGISCGGNHTIAITNDTSNNLWVCGYNNFGQLGIGNNSSINTFTNELSGTPFNNKKVIGISCGSIYTSVITNDLSNNLWVCGYNFYGQLGLGNNSNINTFTNELSGTLFKNKKIISVSCGGSHTIAITDNSRNNLWGCGYNLNGQLGLNISGKIIKYTNNIINKRVIGVSYGSDHIIAITDDSSKNMWVCGSNSNGQLGLGTFEYGSNINTFTNELSGTLFKNKKVIGVSCGNNHTIAITDDTSNNMWVCGYNEYGQLGLGTFGAENNINTFTNELSGTLFKNKKVIGGSCGNNHTIVITNDTSNNVWVCGYNLYGQLGLGTFGAENNRNIFTNELSGSPFNNKKVIGVSCGSEYTIAITDDTSNNMWVCGYNQFGQLGLDNNSDINTFTNELSGIVFNNKKVIGISCGSDHTIAITDDASNNLWVCGYNVVGQLGLGISGFVNNRNTFTNELSGTPFGNKKVISISCGSEHTNVITDDTSNNLWVCGSNLYGQLGLNDNTNRYIFTNNQTESILNKKFITKFTNKPISKFKLKTLKNKRYEVGSTKTITVLKFIRRDIKEKYDVSIIKKGNINAKIKKNKLVVSPEVSRTIKITYRVRGRISGYTQTKTIGIYGKTSLFDHFILRKQKFLY